MFFDCTVLSSADNECHNVFEQWHRKAEYCVFLDNNYLSIQLLQGHVFFFKVDTSIYKATHDNNIMVDIDEYNVYSVSSRNIETIKCFIRHTSFSNTCLFENDDGMIVSLQEIHENDSFFYGLA